MTQSPLIIENLCCSQCGYDLRTLHFDSNCPECGHAIADSIKMGPLGRWLAGFRRGVSFLCLAFIIGAPQIEGWIYDQGWDRMHVNPEGFTAVFLAMLFLLGAWFLTTPKSRRPANCRLRKLVLSLVVLQFIFGLCELRFFRHPWPFDRTHGNRILMTAYALEPLVFVALLWSLLEILHRSLPLLRRPIPRWLFRLVQWSLIYSRLGPAIFFGIVCFGRIKDDDIEPPGFRYAMPERLSRFLEATLITPANHLLIPAWFCFLVVLVYLRYRIRQGRIDIALNPPPASPV